MNPLFSADFYKLAHVHMDPPNITRAWSNWTPRYTHRKDYDEGVVWFGAQAWIREELLTNWGVRFFQRPWKEIQNDYILLVQATLGQKEVNTSHIKALHDYGRLPLDIYMLPEGTLVPYGVPTMVLVNTDPRFAWVVNYLESKLSNSLWKASTSATTARQYRKLIEKHVRSIGETDEAFIDWMAHDFSYRGTSGEWDATMSGMGHLLFFKGTDTIPAIFATNKYYDAPLSVGGSVPATEHSIMCAGGKENEEATFRRLLTEVCPTGVVSIVSDTWDLWNVLTNIIPNLKDVILARDGKLVIRPDSGDPVKIICGDENAHVLSNEWQGAAMLLEQVMSSTIDKTGYRHINKAGLIYGDSITLERADQILTKLIKDYFHPYNMVFGVGSFTYEYVTRDTDGWAMKRTAIEQDGKVIPIWKKPVTDTGGKTSHKGIPIVYYDHETTDTLRVVETTNPNALDTCAFRKVFQDGRLIYAESFSTIQERARATCK